MKYRNTVFRSGNREQRSTARSNLKQQGSDKWGKPSNRSLTTGTEKQRRHFFACHLLPLTLQRPYRNRRWGESSALWKSGKLGGPDGIPCLHRGHRWDWRDGARTILNTKKNNKQKSRFTSGDTRMKPPQLRLKGATGWKVSCFKFLGTYISEDLQWSINTRVLVKQKLNSCLAFEENLETLWAIYCTDLVFILQCSSFCVNDCERRDVQCFLFVGVSQQISYYWCNGNFLILNAF